jgi:hypothetical protein
MSERIINVNDGGDYVEGDKVAGDKVMGSKIDKQVSIGGSVSGSNINLGDNVSQNLAPDNRSLEELLQALTQAVHNISDESLRNLAGKKLNILSEQLSKPDEKRDKSLLSKALDTLQDIGQSTVMVTIAGVIKNKLGI